MNIVKNEIIEGGGNRTNNFDKVKKLFLGILTCLFSSIFLSLFCFGNTVEASNLIAIPDSQKSLNALNKATQIKLDLTTYDHHQWSGIEGTAEYYKPGTNDYRLMFKVPSDYRQGSGQVEYNNCLDIYFNNVTRIANRNVNAKVHIDKVILGSPITDLQEGYQGWFLSILPNSSLTFGNAMENWDIHEVRNFDTYMSLELTYADDNSLVNLPFYQKIADIDIYRSASNENSESWEAIEGYSGDIYHFKELTSTISGMKITSNSSSAEVSGNDSLLKAGCIFSAKKGSMKMHFSGMCCAMYLNVYSEYIDMDNPVKAVNSSPKYYLNDTVTWKINSPRGSFFENTFSKYSKYEIYDILDERLTYVSARLYDGSQDVTSTYGTISYDSSTRKVTYKIKDSILNNTDFYTGQDLRLEIDTKIKTVNNPKIKNKGFVNISNGIYESNEVSIDTRSKITTEVENGVIDSGISNITPGSNKTINYHENDGYMMKSITVDGKTVDWSNHFNSYNFTNIQGDHHIKVVYEKIPTTNLTVQKSWNDTNNNDGFRPTSMTVNFLKNNTIQETITLNSANSWKATKSNLRLYTPRREVIVYDWSENMNFTNNNKYKQTNKTTTNGVTTFTNTHELEKITSKVTKKWDDTNNNDGFRPDSVNIKLYKDGIYVKTVTLNENNKWTHTEQNLLKYKPAGQLVTYTWEEDMTFPNHEKYTKKNQIEGYNTTITNSHKLEEVTSKINLYWEDTDNNDGYRPNEVKVVLYKNNEVYKQITLNKNQNWEYTEEHLLKYSPIGQLNTYYWKEVEDYTNHDKYEILETVQKGYNTEITNLHELERVTSTITKNWNDTNNNDGFRPTNIYVKLYQDDEVIKDRVILNDGNKFKLTEYNLLKFHNQGIKYNYYWEEDADYVNADKYTSSKTQDNYDTTITNTHELEKVEVNVQKIWIDENNHDKVRPSSIQVNLLGNGKFIESVQLSSTNDWKATISNLNKYEPYGKIIHYTFEEPVLYYDYESEVVTEGYNTVITNTRDLSKTSRTVKKIWNDNNNQDQMRPSSVEVKLLANGEVIQTVYLSESNNWTEKINNLNYKDDNGEIIQYEFKESNIPQDYEASYDTNGKDTTITNTYTSEKTKVTVIKKWEDNNNQDGIRPTSVEMRLYANGEATKYKVTLNSRNDWTDSIANLDKYKDGKEIKYEFKEESQIKGYEASTEQNGNLIIITNTHIPETVASEVEKTWNDENNIYDIRPDSIQVNLLANNEVVQMITLSEVNNWKYSINNLPKYENGKEIIYSWQEVEEPIGYLVTYKQDGNKTTITNSFEPYVRAPEEGLSVSIKKEWNDNNNADKLRPDEIEVLLLANHRKVVERIILNKENNWSAIVENLNDANGLIKYTWEENGLPLGYYNEVETEGNETIITNIHEPDKASITLKKEWNDDNNKDGIRPKSIDFALLANGEQIQKVELNEENDWITTITDLPLNDENGLIEYTCKELSYLEGYTSSIETSGGLITITNTHKTEMVELKVSKKWVDENNIDNIRPEEIKVNLIANDNVVKEIILNSKNDWTESLTVPKNENGKKINYQFVEETKIDDYQVTYQQKDNETVIVNTYNPETIDLEVQKIWIDDDNRDGYRPDKVTVVLMKNDKPTDIKLVLNKDNDWFGIIEKQPKYENGKEIKYNFVLENEIDKYTTQYEQNGYKTTIISEYKPEEVTLKVKQNWIDDNNKDGFRPDEVIVVLVIDGKPSDIKLKLNQDNNWQSELNQPKYRNGKEIKYNSILEKDIDKYTTEYSQEGYTTIITSEYSPEKVKPEIQIIWDDLDNKFNKRPNEVTVRLYINGEASDIVITLNEDNNWYVQLDSMDKYKNGKEIEYKFIEDVPKDYKESYEYNGNRTIITNYLREDESEITNPESTPKTQNLVKLDEAKSSKEKVNLEDGKADKVKTEDVTMIYIFIGLICISGIYLIYKHKKK